MLLRDSTACHLMQKKKQANMKFDVSISRQHRPRRLFMAAVWHRHSPTRNEQQPFNAAEQQITQRYSVARLF
jgi:hypothetical protein